MPYPEIPTLDQMLGNPTMKEAFMDYNANKQYEPDQIPFLIETQEFREMAKDPTVSAQALSEKAAKIGSYIRDDGSGVNIGNGMSKEMLASVEEVGHIATGKAPMPPREELAETFRAAEDEMRKLLNTNGLGRFMKTPEFQTAKDIANEELDGLEQQIKGMESRIEQLQNSRWERIKAIFTGGAKQEQEKLLAQIDKTKMEILLKTDPKAFEQLQQGKRQMAQRQQEKQQKLEPLAQQAPTVKAAMMTKSLEKTGFANLSKKESRELDKTLKNADRVQTAENVSKRAGELEKEVQKSIKVGDTLKGKLGQKPEGQSPKIKVG